MKSKYIYCHKNINIEIYDILKIIKKLKNKKSILKFI